MLSLGNTKLPTTTAIFSLPAIVTCPGSTKLCRKYCYALKAERMYKMTLTSRIRNLAISESSLFVELMIDEIKTLWSKGKIKKVRIHESGDFYSQEYLDKWQTIIESLPQIPFYFYTRSHKLDFSAVQNLKNVYAIFSYDESSTKAALKKSLTFARTSTVIGSKSTLKTKDNTFVCGGDCKVCSICSSHNRFNLILFKKH